METSGWLLKCKKYIREAWLATRQYLRKQNKSVEGLDRINFDTVYTNRVLITK